MLAPWLQVSLFGATNGASNKPPGCKRPGFLLAVQRRSVQVQSRVPFVPLSRCFKKGRNSGGESEKRGDAGEGVKYAPIFKRVS